MSSLSTNRKTRARAVCYHYRTLLNAIVTWHQKPSTSGKSINFSLDDKIITCFNYTGSSCSWHQNKYSSETLLLVKEIFNEIVTNRFNEAKLNLKYFHENLYLSFLFSIKKNSEVLEISDFGLYKETITID